MNNDELAKTILYDMKRAEINAWKALAGYKFWMFGYWAAKWVGLNHLFLGNGPQQSNPFKEAVALARIKILPKEKQEKLKQWIDSLPEP